MYHVRQENLPFVGSSHEFVGADQMKASIRRNVAACSPISVVYPSSVTRKARFGCAARRWMN